MIWKEYKCNSKQRRPAPGKPKVRSSLSISCDYNVQLVFIDYCREVRQNWKADFLFCQVHLENHAIFREAMSQWPVKKKNFQDMSTYSAWTIYFPYSSQINGNCYKSQKLFCPLGSRPAFYRWDVTVVFLVKQGTDSFWSERFIKKMTHGQTKSILSLNKCI